MVWTSHADQIRVQFLPIAILPFGILPLVCAPDASGGGHRLPAVATRGVYPVPRLQPPDELPDGQHLNASVAQLAEHALRKRMVVGSIPTGGFAACPPPPHKAEERPAYVSASLLFAGQ